MPAKTNANDVPDAIDIEELTRNLEGAKAECSYDYRLARCPCHRHASLFLMEALAPRLARRVVADAAKLREVRAALEELVFVFEDVRQYPLCISQKVTERLAADGRAALAKLRGATS